MPVCDGAAAASSPLLLALPGDVLLCVCRALPLVDVERLRAASRRLVDVLDDDFYRAVALREYGATFWRLAAERPRLLSRPLPTWREELVRIERFQSLSVSLTGTRVTIAEFVRLWQAQSRSYALHRLRRPSVHRVLK